jgi:probable phosphoglycerate mutase
VDLILVRHAEPVRLEDVPDGADPHLSDVGVGHARRVGAWLAEEAVDHIVTSPLLRARETAAPLAERLGLTPEVLEGIGEFDARDSSYIPFEEMPRDHEKWEAMVNGTWTDIEGWMDPKAFERQVVDAMEGVVTANPGRRVAVFTHGGVINVYLAHVIGTRRTLWFYPGYTSIHRVTAARTGERSVASVNETPHLQGERLAALGGSEALP